LVNDGGACVDSDDGNSWKAVFPIGLIDIRQFGTKPDGVTAADAAFTAADAYSSRIGACTLVPSLYPGFTFRKPIKLSGGGSNCLIGDRGIKSLPASGRFGRFFDLNFTNDTDGVVVNANNGWYVGKLSIKGHAAKSTSPVHTAGLYIAAYEGKVEDLFIQDFVVCKYVQAPSNRFSSDQSAYPNIRNDYPFTCTEMDAKGGSGAAAAFQESGGECRAAAGGAAARYIADGTTTWYQMCAPATFKAAGPHRTGAPLACSRRTEYGVPLWRADGLKVRLGSGRMVSNGQYVSNASLKVCGVDYTIWDVSAPGGGGSRGKQLYCNRIGASLRTGSTTVSVASTSGIPSGLNILVAADHGIPVAAKVERILDGTHRVLSNAPYITSTINLDIVQLAVATSGPPDYAQDCQTPPGQDNNYDACGYKIEIRFMSPPAAGTL
jgi:hypothetical protein